MHSLHRDANGIFPFIHSTGDSWKCCELKEARVASPANDALKWELENWDHRVDIERDNLIHRLGLDKSKHSKGAPSLTTNCALLPMSPIKGPVAPLPISPRADDDAAAAAAAAGAEEETGEVFAVPT